MKIAKYSYFRTYNCVAKNSSWSGTMAYVISKENMTKMPSTNKTTSSFFLWSNSISKGLICKNVATRPADQVNGSPHPSSFKPSASKEVGPSSFKPSARKEVGPGARSQGIFPWKLLLKSITRGRSYNFMRSADARPAPTFNNSSFRDLTKIRVLSFASLNFRQIGTAIRIVFIIIVWLLIRTIIIKNTKKQRSIKINV